MLTEFSRMELIIGEEAVKTLKGARVAVFGVGGVGSYVIESLARCGVGTLDIVDDDVVCLTNINRQLVALHSTISKKKVDVMKNRILDINPEAIVNTYECFYCENNKDDFPFAQYDYVVDAIDTVAAKLLLIQKAKEANVPVISSMGVGNKLYPEKLVITDIGKTYMCPLAKVMRKELKARGIKKCKVVYSPEKPISPIQNEDTASEMKPGSSRRQIPGSISFVPSVAGLLIAGEVVRDLIKK